ncbi:MAG: hypothetical protein Faunusvirus52_5 [Faunusvirus sp.]|jgi:hypothetical protein|uniref:Uncharacterized protein n=1 Tax=Faunusvirus sp. TaxID=2487766 RepID=A0A3G4ZXZ9_9VIRU|nr:MAG: hypothetical protein Faunusvirus52_5 [Faunusvirus sp.]
MNNKDKNKIDDQPHPVDKSKITPQFQEMVTKWVGIVDSIQEKNTQIKELREDKKQFEEFILHTIEQIDKSLVLNIGNGSVRRTVTKSRGPINEDLLKKKLFEYTKNEDKAAELTKMILDGRTTVEKVTLERTIHRERKSKQPKNPMFPIST